MNSELRKAINQRNMWRGKHFRCRTNIVYRQKYVKFHNKVVRLRKIYIQNYFNKRCVGTNSKDFFKTITPFISGKSQDYGQKIFLKENDSLISDPVQVAEVFNDYYASLAEYKNEYDGQESIDFEEAVVKHENHTGVALIKSSIPLDSSFSFVPVSMECMSEYISIIKSNKAAGYDNIKPLFVQKGGLSMCSSLCTIFNSCISSCSFPSPLKCADISPIFKKSDALCKENYRSVNILPVISKIFERIFSDQLISYFNNILCSSLSAYRAGYSCQYVILQMTEYWRKR